MERSLHRTDLAPPVGLTMAHAAVSEFDAEAWNPPFLPPQDSPPSIPHFQGFGRSSANWPVQSDVLNFAALSVLDVPAASSLPINVSFGHNFMRPQDAKITGIRFDVYVTPKQSVQVGINDVVASAINLLAFAPCLPQQL